MSGLTDCPPAGCPPVVIQVVLEGVVVSSLLHIVSQRVVVLDYLLTEELPPLLILEVSWPDSMVLGGMSGGGDSKPLPVHLHVKPGLHLDHVLA